MLGGLHRTAPGRGVARLRVRSRRPIDDAARVRDQADRSLVAGAGWNLRRGELLIVKQPQVELAAVIAHLADLDLLDRAAG